MGLDGVDPVSVGVLVLIDQYDRVLIRQDAPELGVVHESDGQDENVVVMDGDTTVVDAPMSKFVFDDALAKVTDFGDFVGPVREVRQ